MEKNFFGSGGLVVACDLLAQLTGGVRATELVESAIADYRFKIQTQVNNLRYIKIE